MTLRLRGFARDSQGSQDVKRDPFELFWYDWDSDGRGETPIYVEAYPIEIGVELYRGRFFGSSSEGEPYVDVILGGGGARVLGGPMSPLVKRFNYFEVVARVGGVGGGGGSLRGGIGINDGRLRAAWSLGVEASSFDVVYDGGDLNVAIGVNTRRTIEVTVQVNRIRF